MTDHTVNLAKNHTAYCNYNKQFLVKLITFLIWAVQYVTCTKQHRVWTCDSQTNGQEKRTLNKINKSLRAWANIFSSNSMLTILTADVSRLIKQ